jgi:ribokinase
VSVQQPLLWVLGNLTIDDVVMPDGTTTMGLCGGNAIYASLGARLWEERVGLAARIGPDFPSEHLPTLREAGVELALTEVPEPSIHNWALYENAGARRFINWVDSGTNLDQSIRPEELPVTIEAARACHVAPMPLGVQGALVRSLMASRLAIIALDPHEDYIMGHTEEVLGLLPLLTIFLPSRREAEALFGRDDPEAAAAAFADAGPAAVAIKLGDDGSIVCVAGQPLRHVPCIPVQTVDPTGCGDAYCGGFVAAYRNGADALTAACHGTVSASFTAETRGALGMLPLDTMEARRRLDQLHAAVSESEPPVGPETTDAPAHNRGSTYAHG